MTSCPYCAPDEPCALCLIPAPMPWDIDVWDPEPASHPITTPHPGPPDPVLEQEC